MNRRPRPKLLSALVTRRGGLFVGSVLYADVVALRATGGQTAFTWATSLAALALVLAEVAAPSSSWTRDETDRGPEDAPRAYATFAFALALATLGVPFADPLLDALGVLALGVGVLSALDALARVTTAGSPGGGTAPAGARRETGFSRAAAALVLGPALLFLLATTLTAFGKPRLAERAPWSGILATTSPLLALLVGALQRARACRLELGARERTRVVVVVASAALGLLGFASLVAFAPTPRVARALGVAGSLASVWILLRGESVQIARIARRALALTVFAGPFAVIGAMVAEGVPGVAAAATVFTAAVVAALSLAIRALEVPFLPAQGAWLVAARRAHAAVLSSEASEAVQRALAFLRDAAGPQGGTPELWMLDPPRVLSIDTAGYPHVRAAELPRTLVDVCSEEPYGTLRVDVLRALEVRRPDLRPLLAWLGDRSALCATIVASGGAPEGVLLIPGGDRREPMALEEVQALKRLADTLSGACQGESALFRSLGRERDASARIDSASDEIERLRHSLDLDAGRNLLLAARLARPATIGVYSMALRIAYDTLERRMAAGAPVALVAPSGVDPVPLLARAHLAGGRRGQPFVVVEGTASTEHPMERWRDPLASPLALADRGMLVLVDGAALPLEVQRLLARALSDRRPPWERAGPLDVMVAFAATRSPEELADLGQMDPQLFARLGDAAVTPIVLPRLAERPEDLHAIVVDRLAREGLRTRGAPVGLDDKAFGRLVEHGFPGEDAELTSIVQRLVARLEGDVVTAKDVDALKLEVQGAMLDP